MPNEDAETLFEKWLAEHGGAVLKVARAYTLTPEDGRDLAQEILLQVWRSLPRFRGQASPTTWCYRVALNTALAWQRNQRLRQARQRPLLDGEDPPAPGDAGRGDLVERLYRAIRRMRGTEAALILLHLDGLSYRQMSEVLGVSEGHVGVKLNRARKALGDLMREEPHDA